MRSSVPGGFQCSQNKFKNQKKINTKIKTKTNTKTKTKKQKTNPHYTIELVRRDYHNYQSF